MSFDRGVLVFLALFVTLAGCASLASPAALAQRAGWSTSPAGLTEIRAFYGGLPIGLGCFLVWCTRTRERLLPGLLVAGFVLAQLCDFVDLDGPYGHDPLADQIYGDGMIFVPERLWGATSPV